jgi:hypothetical protein
VIKRLRLLTFLGVLLAPVAVWAAGGVWLQDSQTYAGYNVFSPLPNAPGAYNSAQTFVSASSGNVAASTATATCPAVAGKTNYVTGFDITSSGATAASVVSPTLTGVLGGTRTYTLAVVAGATLQNQTLSFSFPAPLQASAVNTAISISVPSLGTGNTNATANIECFYQ